MIEDLPWMYYGKYRKYLAEINHPFRDKIDFIVDLKMNLSKDVIMNYPVLSFYFRDPLKFLYPEVYSYVKHLKSFCKKHNIIFVNDPDALSRSSKIEQLNILATHGISVAKVFNFKNITDLFFVDDKHYPLFIRNAYGHDSDNLTMQGPFYSYKELMESYRIQDETKHLRGSVAIQWIDTKSKHDGLYRRCRVFATKESAVTGNVWVSKDWYIHGMNNIMGPIYMKENGTFQNRNLDDKEKEFFTKINNVLDLEFSAIDYAYTNQGEIVVWEANPHPAFPAWVDAEPTRTKVTNLLSDLYSGILSQCIS